jgi:hypothetical protein
MAKPKLFDKMAAGAKAKKAKAPSTKAMSKLSTLAHRMMDVTAQVEELEAQLSEAKKKLENFKINELPGAMAEIGMSEFALEDGTKFSTKPFYQVSYQEGMKAKAFDWLREEGHGDLIKHSITVPIAMGASKDQKEIVAFLKKKGFTFEDGESVHGNTLKAFTKKQLEGGESLPEELFKVHSGTTIKIKEAK